MPRSTCGRTVTWPRPSRHRSAPPPPPRRSVSPTTPTPSATSSIHAFRAKTATSDTGAPKAKAFGARLLAALHAQAPSPQARRRGVAPMTSPLPLTTFFKGWEAYQRRLVTTVAALTPEQLTLRAAPNVFSVGKLARHIIATRVGWFHLLMGEGSPDLAPMWHWDGSE